MTFYDEYCDDQYEEDIYDGIQDDGDESFCEDVADQDDLPFSNQDVVSQAEMDGEWDNLSVDDGSSHDDGQSSFPQASRSSR